MRRASVGASPPGRARGGRGSPSGRRPGATARSLALIGGAARLPRPPASPPPPPLPRPGSAFWPAGSRLRRRHSLLRRRPGPSQRPPCRSRVAARAAARGPAMSGSAAAAVAVAAASAAAAAAAAAHFQPRPSSPRPGPAELGPPRRPRPPPPPPPPRPEPAAAGRLSPPGHGPLRTGTQGGGACGRASGAGTGSAGGAGRAGRGEGQPGAGVPRRGRSFGRHSFVQPGSPREPRTSAELSASQSVFAPAGQPPPAGWAGQDLGRNRFGRGGN